MRELHTLSELKHYALAASDGAVGHIEQAYFDDREWLVRYFVVRAGGWLLGRDVLVAPRSIAAIDPDAQRIDVALAREAIEHAPPLGSERPISRRDEIAFHRHFEWPPYWEGPNTGAPLPRPRDAAPADPDDPHLRDSAELVGYHLQALDGELGRVHDLVLDDQAWTVRYVVVDTQTWWPGKKVLVAPAWIRDISWAARAMNVDLERELIRSAPAYTPGALISHDDEVRLHAHYGRSMQARMKRADRPG